VEAEGDASFLEQVNDFVRPHLFAYQLSDFAGGALAQLADLAIGQFICTPYGPRTWVQHIYAFRPRELEALTPLHEFARDVWHPWQTTFMTGMQAALGHDVYPAAVQ
jgi:hypothetical protein